MLSSPGPGEDRGVHWMTISTAYVRHPSVCPRGPLNKCVGKLTRLPFPFAPPSLQHIFRTRHP